MKTRYVVENYQNYEKERQFFSGDVRMSDRVKQTRNPLSHRSFESVQSVISQIEEIKRQLECLYKTFGRS